MHAYIIAGGSLDERMKHIDILTHSLGISKFDTIRLNNQGTSIGIKDVRYFEQSLQLKPTYSKKIIGFIQQADQLTQAAQQALLVTIEEPPPHAVIVLEVQSDESLLPTICSRCQIIRLQSAPTNTSGDFDNQNQSHLTTLMNAKPGQIIQTIDTIGKTKEHIISFVDTMLSMIHTLLTHDDAYDQQKRYLSVAHGLLHVKKYIHNNIQPVLLIDHVFLSAF
jgi:hypothetical protein